MKLKKTILRNIILRHSLKKKELQVRAFKLLVRLKSLSYISLLNVYSKLNKRGIRSKINNTCFVTSRNNGIYRKFNLSRIKVKELGSNALILGFKKYSW